MSSSSRYPYASLTSALDDVGSPLRQYLDSTFPNRQPLQTAHRAAAGALLVSGGEAVNPGAAGAAFDFMVRLVMDPSHIPQVAASGVANADVSPDVFFAVVQTGQEAAAGCRSTAAPEELARAAWALALYTEVYRIGMVVPGSPLSVVVEAGSDAVLEVAQATRPCVNFRSCMRSPRTICTRLCPIRRIDSLPGLPSQHRGYVLLMPIWL